MKRKAIISIFILGVLLVQMGFITGTNVGATTATVQGENIFVDSMRKYILSFETESSFNQYLVENQPDRFYPELKMVIAKDWLSNRDDLNSIEGVNRVFDVTNTRFYFTENTGNQPTLIASTNGVKLTISSADMLNVTGLWGEGYDGYGIVICDIDTGINENHVDFAGRILGDSKSFVSPVYGHTTTNPSIDDVHSHGSHTAGIAAGDGTGNPDYIGMAPQASLLVLKVSDIDSIPIEAILGALNYTLYLGYVDVINFSIGGSDSEGQDLEEALMKILVLSGIVISCSAGNEATGPVSYFTVGSPGTAPQVISVAAIKYTGIKAPWSSMGPSADGFVKPDLAAPGVGIYSVGIADDTAYVSKDGTSMAAPHITGTAAVLIQAVNASGIDYDAGLIKTALMKSSEMRGEYLIYGAGLPDAGNAFHIIDDAPVNATGYPIILWAIPEMPIQWYETMPQGFQTLMYVESVSSTPYEDLHPVISGDIKTIMTIDTTPETEPWTKNYALQFSVAEDATVGVYEGYITFETSNGVNASTYVKVTVIEGHSKIYYAKQHTNWRIDNFLGQYLYVISDLLQRGFAVNEFKTGEITAGVLADYDMIWFADPFNRIFPELETNPDIIETYNPLTTAEKTAIQQFVDNGGGLYIDLLGRNYEQIEHLAITILSGNNVTMVNDLIEPFNITVQAAPYDFSSVATASVSSSHKITDGVAKIDHWGTTLLVDEGASILTKYSGKGTTAVFENENGGRVCVATTNFHLDTSGYREEYNTGTKNKLFSLNTFEWLTAKEKVQGSYVKDETGVTFDLTVIPSYVVPTGRLTLTAPSGTTAEDVDLTDVGVGQYQYRLDYTLEGTYKFVVTTSDDKYIASILYDLSPPIVYALGGWVNNTVMEGARLDFEIVEDVTSIASVQVTLNGDGVTTYGSGQLITFLIFKSSLIDGEDNFLIVIVTDAAGNQVVYNFIILTVETTTETTTETETTSTTDDGPISTIAAIMSIISLAAIIYVIRRKSP